MGVVLGANQYGKSENRVVRVYRDTDRHEIRGEPVNSHHSAAKSASRSVQFGDESFTHQRDFFGRPRKVASFFTNHPSCQRRSPAG